MRRLILFLLIVGLLALEVRHFASGTRAYANLSSAASDSIQELRDRTLGRAASEATTFQGRLEDAAWNTRSRIDHGYRWINQGILDTSITAAVKMKLANDETVPASQVHVETRDGVVLLTGTVARPEEAGRAVELAWAAEGVTQVDSRIRVGEASAAMKGGTTL